MYCRIYRLALDYPIFLQIHSLIEAPKYYNTGSVNDGSVGSITA